MISLMNRARNQRGFTLIELLITILIIGILAAIGLAAYNGQRDRARDAKAQTAVRNALTAAKSFYTQKETYVGVENATTGLKAEEATLNVVTSLTTGSAAVPTNILVDGGPSPATTPTATVVRLCSASESGKVFCITDNMGPTPSTSRQQARQASLAANGTLTSPTAW